VRSGIDLFLFSAPLSVASSEISLNKLQSCVKIVNRLMLFGLHSHALFFQAARAGSLSGRAAWRVAGRRVPKPAAVDEFISAR
jgi:hypothetical protein